MATRDITQDRGVTAGNNRAARSGTLRRLA
jgi:hypothetical protein